MAEEIREFIPFPRGERGLVSLTSEDDEKIVETVRRMLNDPRVLEGDEVLVNLRGLDFPSKQHLQIWKFPDNFGSTHDVRFIVEEGVPYLSVTKKKPNPYVIYFSAADYLSGGSGEI